ncbi:MAG: hypothetical protein J5I94_25065, partial [Phaeodactylibacter sp.]|nr:hypothetical protein [Phaeodactylibacter sp.]
MFKFFRRFFRTARPAYSFPPEVGAYYAVRHDERLFKVIKVLAVDEENGHPFGVHLRLFGRLFEAIPEAVDPGNLDPETAPGNGEMKGLAAALEQLKSEEMAIGHLPYLYEAFQRMDPRFIQPGEVSEDELEGYYMWKDAN